MPVAYEWDSWVLSEYGLFREKENVTIIVAMRRCLLLVYINLRQRTQRQLQSTMIYKEMKKNFGCNADGCSSAKAMAEKKHKQKQLAKRS